MRKLNLDTVIIILNINRPFISTEGQKLFKIYKNKNRFYAGNRG